jgi:hypothetical protein
MMKTKQQQNYENNARKRCIDVADEYAEECRGIDNSEATVWREWSY